jgi:hypothetical protein
VNPRHRLAHYRRKLFSRDLGRHLRTFLENSRRRRVASGVHRLAPLPLPATDGGPAVVHVLTSRDMWQPALWAIRSLLFHLGRPLPAVIHHDGSLARRHQRAILQLIPGVRLVAPGDVDPLADHALAPWPECRAARRESLMARKLIDPWLVAPGRDAILLDSDVLFFGPPTELADWLAGSRAENLWNGDYGEVPSPAYSVDPAAVERAFGFRLPSRINTGLGAVAARSMDWSAVEAFLAFERPTRDTWLVEQTTYAFLSARFGVRLLPPVYEVAGAGCAPVAGLISRHYVGRVRGKLFDEGIPHLRRQLLGPATSG